MRVYFFNRLAGYLVGSPEQGITFTYDAAYVEAGGLPISLSLPLRVEPFTQRECLPYFEGLLPDGDLRKAVADHLHVSDRSTLKLLEILGKECAGTVSVVADEESGEMFDRHGRPGYRPIGETEIADMIRNRPFRPMIHGDDEIRLSLAGAQDKIALALIDGGWYLPLNGAPSTHIVKPSRDVDLYKTIAANEFVCTKLASVCGLNVPECCLSEFAGFPAFVAKRYDRNMQVGELRSIVRLHQEDVCQALGIRPDNKYEADGGPSITSIVHLLQRCCSQPILDIQQFIKSVIFNFMIGNCDAHGKNYSLLENDGRVQLAPLYDLACTMMYPALTCKLSMKVGRHYDLRKVDWEDFLQMGALCGIGAKAMRKMRDALAADVMRGFSTLERDPFCAEVALSIRKIAETQIARL